MHVRRLVHRLVALVAFAAASSAQNPFLIFPQDPERQTITCSPFTRRPDWNNAGEGLIEIDARRFRGVGDESGVCQVHGYWHWAGDYNGSTPETYGLVVRLEGPAGGPDPSPAGLLLSIPGLTVPGSPGAPSRTLIMTDIFATPLAVPCTGTWYAGVDFTANPLWPATDGHAFWGADYQGLSTATVGDNPRLGAPHVNWAVLPSGVVRSSPWTTIQGPLVVQPTLHVGGDDPTSGRQGATGGPNFGAGGLFPDVSGLPRSDGITLRVQDRFVPNGVAFLAGAFDFAPTPIPFGGILGQLHLDLASLATLGFVQMSGGAGNYVVALPSTISPAFVGATVMFQGAVADPVTGNVAFTNAQATSL